MFGNVYARDVEGDGRADVMFESGSGYVVAFSEGRTFHSVARQLGVAPYYDNGEGFSFVPIDLDGNGSIELFGYHDDIIEDNVTGATFETRLYVMSGATGDGFTEEGSVVLEEECSVHASEGFTPRGPMELDGDGHPDILVEWAQSCPEDFDTTLGVMFRP